MASTEIRRGDIWLTAWGAARAGEVGKHRPGIIVSVDELNADEAGQLIVLVPLTSSRSESVLRPRIDRRSGIDRDSVAVPRAVRGMSRSRLLMPLGRTDEITMGQIDAVLGLILGLRP